jgi:Carboxypeptidase regulatory-like domain/CarboxypepD_reg-like domain
MSASSPAFEGRGAAGRYGRRSPGLPRCVAWGLLGALLGAELAGGGWALGVGPLHGSPPERLMGTVVDNFTGGPVGGATVLTSAGTATVTAANGSFEFNASGARSVDLTVSASGYRTTQVSFDPDANASPVVVPLDPYRFTVSGIVLAANSSEPVPGANVSARPGPATTTTATDGSFRLSLPNGSFRLTVTAVGYDVRTQTLAVSGGSSTAYLVIAPSSGATGLPPGGGPGSGGGGELGSLRAWLSTPIGRWVATSSVASAAALALFLLLGRRGGRRRRGSATEISLATLPVQPRDEGSAAALDAPSRLRRRRPGR